jgi:hypothetical protein
MSTRGRTAQVVALDLKVLHFDELAEFGWDRPCQRECGRFSANDRFSSTKRNHTSFGGTYQPIDCRAVQAAAG